LYWTEQNVERFAFLERLLDLLDRHQWRAAADSGWDEFDVTVYGDRFSKVLVKTVAENHGGRKRLLRARLIAQWTLGAKIAFAVVVAEVAFLVGITAHVWWIMPLTVAVPLTALYLHWRAKRTLRLTAALLDLAADELGLLKMKPGAGKPDTSPAAPTVSAAAKVP
jgi:hypothetical protein